MEDNLWVSNLATRLSHFYSFKVENSAAVLSDDQDILDVGVI